jgi:hypothetical protein
MQDAPTQYVTKADLDVAMARLQTAFRGDLGVEVARLEVLIERSAVTQIRWLVGLSFGLYGLMFALILFVIARELPH